MMALATGLACFLSSGCGGGDGGISNKNPGNNDLNVVVALGDSITAGSECPCVPYPARLSGMINKVVYNSGIGGSETGSGLSRIQGVINSYHPAFMLILYGVNDIIQSGSPEGAAAAPPLVTPASAAAGQEAQFLELIGRYGRMANLISTYSDVFEIHVTAEAGYISNEDVNSDGQRDWRYDFVTTAQKKVRTIYER